MSQQTQRGWLTTWRRAAFWNVVCQKVMHQRMCSHNEMDTHGTATISAMDTNIHVHGLQDRHCANLCPSKTICTPLFVVAQHCHQSISVDCFPVHEQSSTSPWKRQSWMLLIVAHWTWHILSSTHPMLGWPENRKLLSHVSCTKSKGQENMYFGKGHLQLREPIQIGGA